MCGRDGGDWLICAMVLSRCVLGVARANWSFHGFIGDKVCQFVEPPRHMLLSTNVLSPSAAFWNLQLLGKHIRLNIFVHRNQNLLL
jgi:hypothetical protein